MRAKTHKAMETIATWLKTGYKVTFTRSLNNIEEPTMLVIDVKSLLSPSSYVISQIMVESFTSTNKYVYIYDEYDPVYVENDRIVIMVRTGSGNQFVDEYRLI